MRVQHTVDYREARRRSYPPIGDQLDALWKAINTLSPAPLQDPTAEAMRQQIAAVKARFPVTR